MSTISGPAAAALASLSLSDVQFLQSLPKAELHAHLNGSIPPQTLLELAADLSSTTPLKPSTIDTLTRLQSGLTLGEISDFFLLFTDIYALTSTPSSLARATTAVLDAFLTPQPPPLSLSLPDAPECVYIELRTTPRATPAMSRRTYLETVLDVLEREPPTKAALIVSVDRRMTPHDAAECVDLAIALRSEGRRVVGLDLCGDPRAGNVAVFTSHFARARAAGLKLTVHVAETPESTDEEARVLLGWRPDRLGHATFLSAAHRALFFSDAPIELCNSDTCNSVDASVDRGTPTHTDTNIHTHTATDPTIHDGTTQPWASSHPLHTTYIEAYHRHLAEIHRASTELEEARKMLSFHCDADKAARRAALAEVLALDGGREMEKVWEKEKEMSCEKKMDGQTEWADGRNGVYKPCVEICLSSNLLCRTVPSLEAHHIQHYLANEHPVAICTDDILPFRTSLLGEYALLLAEPPCGLGLGREQVKRIAQMGMDARFCQTGTSARYQRCSQCGPRF